MRVADAIGTPSLEPREARLLLAAASGFSQASLLAHPERELPGPVRDAFLDFASRRSRGEPVAYIVGRKEFHAIELAVTPAVLIPRPETELLVELALELSDPCAPARILDLGTGSGAVALALKHARPQARVVAVEASAAALAVAQRNAVRLGLAIELRHGRWFAPVAGERFDVVVANPPYVAAGDPHLEALGFEPREALVAGADGLEAIREIAAAAAAHLAPAGWLLVEHGLAQEGAVRALFSAAGLEAVRSWPDLTGIARATGGRLKSD